MPLNQMHYSANTILHVFLAPHAFHREQFFVALLYNNTHLFSYVSG